MKLLALDFDGVIADGSAECYVSGYNAYQQATGGVAEARTTIDVKILSWKEYSRLRNYIKHSRDYVYIFHSAVERVPIASQIDFDRFMEMYPELADLYTEAFQHERMRFLKQSRRRWLDLNPLYPGMRWFLAQSGEHQPAIVSTKKPLYIRAILEANGIELAAEKICYASGPVTKRTLIAALLRADDVAVEECIFVDDQVQNLLEVLSLGVECRLAGWGYNDRHQRRLARQARIPVPSLEDFYSCHR